MDIKNLQEVEAFITKDGSEIRELLAYRNSNIQKQSLAEARLKPGARTAPHYHPKTEEIYYILRGAGEVTIGQQSRGVGLAGQVLRYLVTGNGILTYAASLVASSVKVLPESATPDVQALFAHQMAQILIILSSRQLGAQPLGAARARGRRGWCLCGCRRSGDGRERDELSHGR